MRIIAFATLLAVATLPVFGQGPRLEIRNLNNQQRNAELWLVDATPGSYCELYRTINLRDWKGPFDPVEVTSDQMKVADIDLSGKMFWKAGVQEGFLVSRNYDLSVHSDRVVVVDEDDGTNGVWAYALELEAYGPNVSIGDLQITFELGEDNSPSDLDGIIDSVGIRMGINGDKVTAESLIDNNTGIIKINDLGFLVEDGETTELIVEVDVRQRAGNFKNWDSIRVREVQIEYDAGSESATLTPEVPTGFVTLATQGLLVSEQIGGDVRTAPMQGWFTYEFKLTAFEGDAYIPKDNGIIFDVDTLGGYVWISSWLQSTDANLEGGHFVIREGETATFQFRIVADNSSGPVVHVETFLQGVRYRMGSSASVLEETRYGFPQDWGLDLLVPGGEY